VVVIPFTLKSPFTTSEFTVAVSPILRLPFTDRSSVTIVSYTVVVVVIICSLAINFPSIVISLFIYTFSLKLASFCTIMF
jgi:hypothetical protein